MPGHYGSHEHNLVSVSSPVATQLLHAVGIALAAKIRKTGQVAMTSMGEGSSNQGDVHEGLNFAAIHKLPFVFVVENNGYAISVPAARQVVGRRRRRPGGRATGSRGSSSTASDVLACYAAARDAVARARAGDGPTPDRGQGDPADRPLVGRPADQVPLRGGAAGRARRTTPLPRFRAAAPRRRRPDRRDRGAPDGRDRGRRRRRDRLRRGRSPTPTRRRRLRYVYAEDAEP